MAGDIIELWDSGEPPGRRKGRGAPPPPPGGGGEQQRPDPWVDAPFAPIGKSGRTLYFFDSAGELVAMAPSALFQPGDLLLLCGQRASWLMRHFPAWDKESGQAWFNVRLAGLAIMERCAAMDMFDPNEAQRRYGLWVVPGGYALHAGRSVLWLGAEKTRLRDAGFRDAGALWPRLPGKPLPQMGDAVASAAIGGMLETKLGSWNWLEKSSPAIALGGIVVGMLGAVAPWRAHLCIVGSSGCGKTTLLRDLAARLSPLTQYRNDYTEAGLRQMLSETAAGVILDEAESDSDGETKLQRVIEMLRRSSSGAGVQSVKGGEGQQAKSFTVSTSAILGCVWPPALTEQDASRITLLELRELQGGGGETAESIMAFVERYGLALWGRAVENAARAVALYHMLRSRLIEHFECAPRMADQLGILAAARWVMVRDAADDPLGITADDGIDVLLTPVLGLVVKRTEEVANSGSNLALQRLMASPVDMQGNKLTLGQCLRKLRVAGDTLRNFQAEFATGVEQEDRAKALETWNAMAQLLEGHGVKWATHPLRPNDADPNPQLGLYVTVQAHPRLSRAFEGTPWGGQRWAAALARLPDAKSSAAVGTVRLGGGKPRCCWVPEKTLTDLTT